MARTTAAQFARQLRRLGATANANGRDVIATYHDVQVTARFASDIDGFDLAWRADAPADTAVIRSMAGVKRALGLPKQPIVIIAGTGRSNSRTHIVRTGWTYIAACGVGVDGRATEGAIGEVTCPKCRSIWRQR